MPGPGPTTAALDALCAEGLSHHQAGRLEEARARYERVLDADARHFGALHLLGVYAIQTGQPGPAAELIGHAIAVRGDVPDAYGNLAHALNAVGRHEEAVAACDRALALNPDFAAAHGQRGDALLWLGRHAEALESFDRDLALRPTPQAHFNRATALRALGRLEAALADYGQAIALRPGDAEAHRSRGLVLSALGRPAAALESHDAAIALRPDHAETHVNRGNALLELGRPEDALASYVRAAALRPDDAEAHGAQVAALRLLQRPDAALAAAERAVALAPESAEAHNRRAAILYDLRRLDAALASYDRAVALRPGYAEALNNRGAVLFELRRLDEALASYGEALARDPELADAHHNQAMCRLALGDFAGGWAQYEWRWRTGQFASDRRDLGAPLWLGETEVAGRTVLAHAEQGLGDTLQFCRYATDLAARGARVVLEVQPGLARLMAALDGVAQVVTRGAALPPCDLQVPLMSLPLALGATPAPRPPYLHAPPAETAAWAQRLAKDGGLRIGLCWAGGHRPGQLVANSIDQRRSLPLEALAPLAGVDGASFYSLQKGPPAAQLAEARARGWAGPEIVDLTDEMGDLADTAAFVANLDLVITCDTAVAHLAGGLGKPVWILNRFDSCWRWEDGRTDTPWYPTARLFNQATAGDWDPVVAEVVQALQVRET